MKIVATTIAFLLLASAIGLGFTISNPAPKKTYDASLSAGGAFGRNYDVSAYSAMIDDDDDATVILSEGNSLRFEEFRLLIDGYVACRLTPQMDAFDVKFSEDRIVVSVEGGAIVDQAREMPRLAGMQRH